jgi:hypothetical protein
MAHVYLPILEEYYDNASIILTDYIQEGKLSLIPLRGLGDKELEKKVS